ncbi:MAG: SWIM zinc finger family protein [Oscillospiraceae bacterium]|nr:SWIM zinc finger family protein [Oscillospiraceae bacterium]MBR3556419.1 SWIM zinc finger family protein [Oscillospiraceae bacterium]
MKIKSWHRFFAPQILSRGQEYYEAELVNICRAEETGIEAAVEGTERYHVETSLREGQIMDMNCDCPYASDGNNCKHMAAVLYAVEDSSEAADPFGDFLAEEQERLQEDNHALKQAVSVMPEEELRALLLDAAKKHRDIRERITMRKKPEAGPAAQKRWKADLARITREASDRSGFIDYYHAGDYTEELWQYLNDKIEPLLENRLIMDAFSLVGLVYTEALDQEMDDSDGGLSFVADQCLTYWRELIPAPEADQEKMLAWFAALLSHYSDSVGEDWLWPVVLEGFTDERLLPTVLDLLDGRIRTAREYHLPGLIKYRLALMERMGKSPEEIEAYRKDFWALPEVRKQKLDLLEAEECWTEALSLLRECEELDKDKPYLLAKYSLRRIGILRRVGPEKAFLEALESYVFGFPQQDMTYVAELKQAVPEESWPGLLDRLFANRNTQSLRRELQLSEGMLEQMMAELEAGTSRYELERVEKALRKVYPQRVRDLMLKLLDREMHSASTRNAYAGIIHSLKRLYGYPEGRKKAAELARSWREKYPRRSAMLDELHRAKL